MVPPHIRVVKTLNICKQIEAHVASHDQIDLGWVPPPLHPQEWQVFMSNKLVENRKTLGKMVEWSIWLPW